MGAETIYIKLPMNAVVRQREVRLSDVTKIESVNERLREQLKDKVIYIFPKNDGKAKQKKIQQVLSVLKVIELIHESFPNAEVESLGETDCVLEYVPAEETKAASTVKTIILCIIIFFGAAFSIMSFNNDVGVGDLFAKFYKQVMGAESTGFTVLEVTYSIGLSLGIIIFYNHVSHKKLTIDPTPVEVELRKYENDMDMTLVESSSRKGNSIDVD